MTNQDDHSQDEYYLTRVANLQKATRIKQAGYKSSIHALPQEVRTKLDEILTWKISPKKALAALCEQYPKVELPSAKAVENYRNKYHKASLSKKITLVAQKEVEIDLLKAELQRTIAGQVEYLATDLLPKLTKRLEKAMEQEEKIGLPLKMVDNSITPLIAVIRVVNDFLDKNDIHLFAEERAKVPKPALQPVESVDQRAAYEKLQAILENRGYILDDTSGKSKSFETTALAV
jgi:hypothetical protein